MIILDDCISDPEFRKSSILSKLFIQGRHLCLSVVVCTQSISSKEGTSPLSLRNNDFFISFYLQSEDCRKLALGKFLSMNGINNANDIFCGITKEKYTAMVINNRVTSQKYDDVVFYYKADPISKEYMIVDDNKKTENRSKDFYDDINRPSIKHSYDSTLMKSNNVVLNGKIFKVL